MGLINKHVCPQSRLVGLVVVLIQEQQLGLSVHGKWSLHLLPEQSCWAGRVPEKTKQSKTIHLGPQFKACRLT